MLSLSYFLRSGRLPQCLARFCAKHWLRFRLVHALLHRVRLHLSRAGLSGRLELAVSDGDGLFTPEKFEQERDALFGNGNNEPFKPLERALAHAHACSRLDRADRVDPGLVTCTLK